MQLGPTLGYLDPQGDLSDTFILCHNLFRYNKPSQYLAYSHVLIPTQFKDVLGLVALAVLRRGGLWI